MPRNAYEVLGVHCNATNDEIKAAYKKLVLRYHPDKGGGDVEAFYEVQAAYHVLSDMEQRHTYDMINAKSKTSLLERVIKALRNVAPQIYKALVQPTRIEDIFIPSKKPSLGYYSTEDVMSTERKPLDTLTTISVSIEELYKNGCKEVKIMKQDTVSKIAFPLFNSHVVIENAGSTAGGETGDAHFIIRCRRHNTFMKKGHDLIIMASINVSELLYGFTKEHALPDGSIYTVALSNPCKENEFDGRSLVVKVPCKGFPTDLDGNRGDLLIVYQLSLPPKALLQGIGL